MRRLHNNVIYTMKCNSNGPTLRQYSSLLAYLVYDPNKVFRVAVLFVLEYPHLNIGQLRALTYILSLHYSLHKRTLLYDYALIKNTPEPLLECLRLMTWTEFDDRKSICDEAGDIT